jgi:hypothetical protein
MSETPQVESERVDDIPLLLAHMERMQLSAVVNAWLPAHGNWQGLSPGQTLTVWLTHILSQADHRLNQVQSWAAKRLHTLAGCVGQPVVELDLSDDRLARLLDWLGEEAGWNAS